MASGSTYQDYLRELIVQEKEWLKAKQSGGDFNAIENIEQNILYNALQDGVDIYALWRDVWLGAYGTPITETQMANSARSLNEIYLIRQFNDTYNRLTTAPEWEKDNIEGELLNILIQDVANGMDGYEMVYQAMWIMNGEPPSAQQIKAMKPRVDAAYAAVNKLNATQKNELKAAPSSSDKKRPTATPFSYHDRWGETYSGADMVVFMAFPGYKPIEIGTASTVSYTTYREKRQIRTLGRISAKGIVKGTRTISGRLIFTVIAEHIVESLRREIPYLRDIKTMLMDELPPFDLLISFGNEYGSGAGLVIQGITTVDEQKTMSVEDMFTENIFTYLAMALEPMRDMHVSNINLPYDPLEWYTSDFRAPWSEALAKFKVEDLMVYKETLLLEDPNPFVGGPEEWDSESAPTIDSVAGVSTGGTNTGDSEEESTPSNPPPGPSNPRPTSDVVKPYGYWSESGHDATSSCQVPKTEDGKPNEQPNPSVRVYNSNKLPMYGMTVDWYYSIADWSNKKNYPAWTLAHDSMGTKVDSKEGKVGSSKTNTNGTSTMPDFDFGKFPETSNVSIIAKARKKAGSEKGDHVESEHWVKFCFYMKPKRDFK